MEYTDIISLADAKNYLRIDDTVSEDDRAISQMINASFRFIENWTNHILEQRDKTYSLENDFVSVYDYPIQEIVSPVTAVETKKPLYSNFEVLNGESELILTVGYNDSVEVPDDLIQVAYEILDIYYYGSKDGQSVGKKLSALSVDTLNYYKRFIL